jgi:hypothetical protein
MDRLPTSGLVKPIIVDVSAGMAFDRDTDSRVRLPVGSHSEMPMRRSHHIDFVAHLKRILEHLFVDRFHSVGFPAIGPPVAQNP